MTCALSLFNSPNYPIWILQQQQQFRCELATPLTSSSNRSPTFWIHILLDRMRQQLEFSQLFCKPLWCSHCDHVLWRRPESGIKGQKWFGLYDHRPHLLHDMLNWGPFCSSFVFIFVITTYCKVAKLSEHSTIWNQNKKLSSPHRFPFFLSCT